MTAIAKVRFTFSLVVVVVVFSRGRGLCGGRLGDRLLWAWTSSPRRRGLVSIRASLISDAWEELACPASRCDGSDGGFFFVFPHTLRSFFRRSPPARLPPPTLIHPCPYKRWTIYKWYTINILVYVLYRLIIIAKKQSKNQKRHYAKRYHWYRTGEKGDKAGGQEGIKFARLFWSPGI